MSFGMVSSQPSGGRGNVMRKHTILVVDDDPFTRKIHSKYLKDPAWRVVEAESGEACLNEVTKSTVSLIVLDLVMPEMDGYEVVTQLKLKKETADIPVILLTAQDDSSFEMNKSYEIGVSDFIIKPADAKILKRKAAVYINQYQKINNLKTDLEKITERCDLILNSLSNPMILIDENEIIVDSNSKLESLLGYMKGEIEGKNISEFVHSLSLDKFRSSLKMLLEEGAIDSREYIIITKDGRKMKVSVNGLALKKIASFEIIA